MHHNEERDSQGRFTSENHGGSFKTTTIQTIILLHQGDRAQATRKGMRMDVFTLRRAHRAVQGHLKSMPIPLNNYPEPLAREVLFMAIPRND